MNAAFYVVEKDALASWVGRIEVGDFAKDLFPAMLAEGARLKGHISFEYIKDIGTPARLDAAERHLRSGLVESGATRSPAARSIHRSRRHSERAEWPHQQGSGSGAVSGRIGGRETSKCAEFRVVIVTNQPVIARGECDERGLAAIHAKLETALGLDGAYLDATYYCPHHPDRGFAGEVKELKRDCACRKPGTGMVDEAARA